jgi:hydrogenase expression/formation protein HypC
MGLIAANPGPLPDSGTTRFGPLRLASLSRNAGEGAERSKAGEGNAAGHTRQPADVGGVASGSRLAHADADHAARFHRSLANAVVEMAARLALGIETAVLSGGAFQNRILLELVMEGRRSRGFRALAPRQVPANDGGLSLGQAVIAGARWLNSSEVPPCAQAFPGQIVAISDADNMLGIVDVSGVRREIHLACIVDDEHPIETCVGDWVLVYVGFAMSRIDEAEAAQTLALLAEFGAIEDEFGSRA